MKTFEKYYEKEDPYLHWQWWEYDKNEETWNACLKEVSEELRNILEYVGNDIDESVVIRIADFCKQIFEETHDE